MAWQDRSAQTGAYLRMLLARPGEPRTAWAKYAPDARAGEIDVTAVCEVLRRNGPDDVAARDPDDLTAAVRSALDGTAVQPGLVDAFVQAFDLGSRNAVRLHDLLNGSDSIRVITSASIARLYRDSDAPRPDTLALHEMHTLGPDGLPAEHQTIQVIKSTVDELVAYPCRFDTDELVFEVVRGGRVGDTYRVTDSFYGVDLNLDRPLARGETALIHYRTTFHYRDQPPLEFRRGVRGTMRDVTMWLRFHPNRLPAAVWLGRWDRLDDASLIESQRLELDGEYSVQARYESVSDAIVGFTWSWD